MPTNNVNNRRATDKKSLATNSRTAHNRSITTTHDNSNNKQLSV